jgi:hypothetical protein
MHGTSKQQPLSMRTTQADSPRRGRLIFAFALAAALLLPPVVGCTSKATNPPTRWVLATKLAGYHINASLDRPATIELLDDHAFINFGRHQLRVEKGRVVLDDNETAAFRITATRIDIEVAGGELRMTADSQEMWKRPSPQE